MVKAALLTLALSACVATPAHADAFANARLRFRY